jgi:hypothetical protein
MFILMNVRCGIVIVLLFSALLSAQSREAAQYISLSKAQPVIQAYQDKLPKSLSPEALHDPTAWQHYVRQRDREVRARLQQGDLDTLANLLLFGTSYTRQPVITPALLNEISSGAPTDQSAAWNTYRQRLHDLTAGLASPGAYQRLIYMRSLLEKQGFRFQTAADLDEVQNFLAANLVRMLRDDQSFAAALETARKADAEAEFKARSQVFEQRGISLDTTLFPNFAIEQALKQLKNRGLLKVGSVERVAVAGPGLDVINKDAGFDFYPEQTIQSFALIDSLVRLGLAKSAQLTVTTLDISANVNSHLNFARQRALQGKSYAVQLPLRSDIHWTNAAVSYWQKFGSAIGKSSPPLAPPKGAGEMKLRAVHIPSSQVMRVRPVDLNVVLQHLALPANRRFDLIIGTNIFVYYGEFEQSLAEINIAQMLKPNGILLTNDALPTGKNSALEEVDFSTTIYSDRKADGDRIVWMRGKKMR